MYKIVTRVLLGILCLGLVLPRGLWAASVDREFQMAVLAPGSTDTTPAPTPTPTPSGGGGAGPPRPIPPQQHPDPYVTGEANVAPYIYVGMIDGVPVPFGNPGTTYSYQPTVTGKTNLRDAVIFIELADAPGRRYTVHANISGIWNFTVPVSIGLGWHTLALTAVSPINPAVRADGFFQFQIIPIPPVPPRLGGAPGPTPAAPGPRPTPVPPPSRLGGITPTPTPAPLPVPAPPAPLPLPPPEQLIDVDLIVQPPNVQITPPDTLPVTVKLKRFVPDGIAPVNVKIKVTDADGRVLVERSRPVVVPDATVFVEELAVPRLARPGRYWVSAEIEVASTTVAAVQPFSIATGTAGVLPLTLRAATPDALVRLGALIAVGFAFLVWWLVEFLRSRRPRKIGPDDLFRAGMVK